VVEAASRDYPVRNNQQKQLKNLCNRRTEAQTAKIRQEAADLGHG
jgi:hypothetical protein